MIDDPDIQNQVYQCFLAEASSLLPKIEQDLLSFLEEQSIDKVHSLMRNTHTLKGSAASAESETIRTVAHHLEDVFKALYNPEIIWDKELAALLWECYECLHQAVTIEITGNAQELPHKKEQTEILNRVAIIFAKLKTKLADFFDREAPLPTSDDLGFDVIGSIFAESMQQELQQLAAILATKNSEQIASTLSSEAEFFIGIAECYHLSGLKELAQTVLTALEKNPNQVIQIAQLALKDFQQARINVLAGDRSRGGEPSPALRKLAKPPKSSPRLDELVKATQLRLFPEIEISAVTPESVEPNHEELGTIVLPLEQQDQDTSELREETAIEQVLQSIGANRQEFAVPEGADFAHQSNQKQQKKTPISAFSSPSSGKNVRVDLLQLENINYILGELLINHNQQILQTNQSQQNTQKALEQLQSCQQSLRQISNRANRYFSRGAEKLPQSLPESLTRERFDSLEMDTYSEMQVLLQSVMETMMQLQENIEAGDFSARQSQSMLNKQKKLLTNAQENMRQARMLPVAVLFNRFPPIVKQLVTIHDQPAQLELTGTHILIDKTIAEKLFDPLLHLLRNAIAHGIESTKIRLQQGKSETGRIRIKAYHQGNRTNIEVADDGRGFNWERIRKLGIEKQLLDPNQAELASESELAELLFEPGFSTAEQITELSGRGVGLDVVRSQIQKLQGSVTVSSVAGEGTVFSLHLPLVLITAEMLVCQSNGLTYALHLESIERVLQPEQNQISSQTLIPGQPQQKFLLWEEGQERQKVPIRTLDSLLTYSFSTDKFSVSTPNHDQKVGSLIMLRQQGQLLCLELEQIITKQELAIKSFSKKPTLPSYIQGYSILSDGHLVMALDPLELVNQTWSQFKLERQARILPQPMTSFSAVIEQQMLTSSTDSSEQLLGSTHGLDVTSNSILQGQSILIVDDSPTQRKLLVLMLEKAGCLVLQAEDGQTAITQLRQHPEIQLIICDIEMPEMNGFEFLYAYRQDSTLSNVDTIMLTSRSGVKHRQMAFELGAKAYLNKPYSEPELLGLLSNLISQKTAHV